MAKVLLRFTELQGTVSAPRPRVSVTQKELVQIVGLSRERTNWLLQLRKGGYLTLKKRGCILENKTIIQKIAHAQKH